MGCAQRASSEKVGPKGAASELKSEIDSFMAFFDALMFDRMVSSINTEIQQHRSQLAESERSRPRYADTSVSELRCFVGVVMYRGLQRDNKIPTEKLFYGKHARPFYRAAMSRDSFKFLKQCVCERMKIPVRYKYTQLITASLIL